MEGLEEEEKREGEEKEGKTEKDENGVEWD